LAEQAAVLDTPMPAISAKSSTRTGLEKFSFIHTNALAVRWLWSPKVAMALSRVPSGPRSTRYRISRSKRPPRNGMSCGVPSRSTNRQQASSNSGVAGAVVMAGRLGGGPATSTSSPPTISRTSGSSSFSIMARHGFDSVASTTRVMIGRSADVIR
jgi:hypothetical protein